MGYLGVWCQTGERVLDAGCIVFTACVFFAALHDIYCTTNRSDLAVDLS